MTPREEMARKLRLVILMNHEASGQWSMLNFARQSMAALSEIGSVRLVTPPNVLASVLPRRWLKYGIYWDVYVLAAIRTWMASFGADLVIAADQAYAPALWLVPRRKRTVYVHDLIAIRQAHGEFPSAPEVEITGSIYQWMVLRSLLSAKVLGVNTDTQSRQLQSFGFSGETVVVGQSIDLDRFQNIDSYPILYSPYFLHVGSDSWVKNKKFLLELFEALYAQLGADCPSLVLAGLTDADTLRIAPRATAGNRILTLSTPTDAELGSLIAGATALIMPSLDEGFGVPPLEALSLGIPAIVSDIEVFHEIYGDSVHYVDILDVGRATSQMTSYLPELTMPSPGAAHEVVARYSETSVADRCRRWIITAARAAGLSSHIGSGISGAGEGVPSKAKDAASASGDRLSRLSG